MPYSCSASQITTEMGILLPVLWQKSNFVVQCNHRKQWNDAPLLCSWYLGPKPSAYDDISGSRRNFRRGHSRLFFMFRYGRRTTCISVQVAKMLLSGGEKTYAILPWRGGQKILSGTLGVTTDSLWSDSVPWSCPWGVSANSLVPYFDVRGSQLG